MSIDGLTQSAIMECLIPMNSNGSDIPAWVVTPDGQDQSSIGEESRKKKHKRDAHWAQRARLKLIEELGGQCVLCGSMWLLQLDHPNGRDWQPRKKSQWGRIAIYRREAKMNLLRVLCQSCNSNDGKKRRGER